MHFGVEDSLDMADLFCIIGELAGGDVMRLFCAWMYCIFSTLPLDVENTVIHTQNCEGGDSRIQGFVCF